MNAFILQRVTKRSFSSMMEQMHHAGTGRDIFYVFKRMEDKLRELSHSEEGDKRHCYSLLYDSLRWTQKDLRNLPPSSLIEFMDLTTATVEKKDADKVYFRETKKKLVELGFNVAPKEGASWFVDMSDVVKEIDDEQYSEIMSGISDRIRLSRSAKN